MRRGGRGEEVRARGGGEGFARRGQRCEEGSLRAREGATRKGECCKEGRTLQGGESTVRMGGHCKKN